MFQDGSKKRKHQSIQQQIKVKKLKRQKQTNDIYQYLYVDYSNIVQLNQFSQKQWSSKYLKKQLTQNIFRCLMVSSENKEIFAIINGNYNENDKSVYFEFIFQKRDFDLYHNFFTFMLDKTMLIFNNPNYVFQNNEKVPLCIILIKIFHSRGYNAYLHNKNTNKDKLINDVTDCVTNRYSSEEPIYTMIFKFTKKEQISSQSSQKYEVFKLNNCSFEFYMNDDFKNPYKIETNENPKEKYFKPLELYKKLQKIDFKDHQDEHLTFLRLNNNIIGYIHSQGNSSVYLKDVIINPLFQNKGVCKYLLSFLIKKLESLYKDKDLTFHLENQGDIGGCICYLETFTKFYYQPRIVSQYSKYEGPISTFKPDNRNFCISRDTRAKHFYFYKTKESNLKEKLDLLKLNQNIQEQEKKHKIILYQNKIKRNQLLLQLQDVGSYIIKPKTKYDFQKNKRIADIKQEIKKLKQKQIDQLKSKQNQKQKYKIKVLKKEKQLKLLQINQKLEELENNYYNDITDAIIQQKNKLNTEKLQIYQELQALSKTK